jgi:hypothetical protein
MNKNPCKIRIRNVSKIGKKGLDYAEVLIKECQTYDKYFDIKISHKMNKRRSVYFRSLVHELIHVAFYVVKELFKWKFTNNSEHSFIERIEDSVLMNWHVLKKVKEK